MFNEILRKLFVSVHCSIPATNSVSYKSVSETMSKPLRLAKQQGTSLENWSVRF